MFSIEFRLLRYCVDINIILWVMGIEVYTYFILYLDTPSRREWVHKHTTLQTTAQSFVNIVLCTAQNTIHITGCISCCFCRGSMFNANFNK